MTKFQEVIEKLNSMEVGDKIFYADFEDICSHSHFVYCINRLSDYVEWDDGYILLSNNIPDRLAGGGHNLGKVYDTNPVYVHRLTVLIDDGLHEKIEAIPAGERSNVVRNILEENL